MMTVDDVLQIDVVLTEDHLNVGFYAWGAEDETIFWSISLPMMVEEAAFDDMVPEWVELGWLLLKRQTD
ncbi:hypothetical protein [Rhizobium sp. H4]|uniref:hypothetical protein n=1 Tax=Rhizobium sp. H4 TaxID=2035449 RepID=UPI000D10248E|nr:hypothetical protein [Rhizobium sp. H4]